MRENLSSGFLTRSGSNWAVQLQKMAIVLILQILEVDRLFYSCSENKGAYQLCGDHTTGMRLYFHICKSRFSHDVAQIVFYNCVLIVFNGREALESSIFSVEFQKVQMDHIF